MGHARDPNELLEVARDELRSVVRDDSGFRLRILFLGSLQDNFDLRLGNRIPQIPMHQETTVSTKHTAQVVERARQVDLGNIVVPVSVGLRRLLKPRPFARGLALPSRQQSRLLQHSPYARRTHRHDLCIQHHERQPPIALQGILQMKTDDGFLLPRLQPEIAGNPTVVLIHSPVALSPVVELAGPNAQPLRESSDADLGLLRPTSDKIHDLIPHIMRHPALGQSSPRLFFKATCSAISSARTSSLVWTFFSKNSIRFCFSST